MSEAYKLDTMIKVDESYGYIENDFDVNEWAAPEFLKQAARELLEDKWEEELGDKDPLANSGRIG